MHTGSSLAVVISLKETNQREEFGTANSLYETDLKRLLYFIFSKIN